MLLVEMMTVLLMMMMVLMVIVIVVDLIISNEQMLFQLLRLMRDCHHDRSHRRQQQCRQCRQQVSPPFSVPLIVTEPSPKGSSSSQHLRGTQPEQLHTSHPGLLSLPHEASSSSSSPHVASSTLTEGSTESDLEMVKDRLKVVEERLAFQELQESTLRVIFKEVRFWC